VTFSLFFYPVSDNFFFCAVWLPFGFTTIHFDIKFCKTPHHSSMCGRETVPSELSARMFITDAYNKLQGHVNHLLMQNRKRRPDHWEEDKRKALKVSGHKRPIIFCHFLRTQPQLGAAFIGGGMRDRGSNLRGLDVLATRPLTACTLFFCQELSSSQTFSRAGFITTQY
jgi:hypothetical protein